MESLALNPKVRSTALAALCVGSGFLLSAIGIGKYPQPVAMGLICSALGWRAVLMALGAMLGYPTFWGSSGNPGMAKGGSGDTLTGILLALLAGGYTPREASIVAPYIHGRAGDIAAARQGMTAMTAGDIIDSLPSAWKMLE